MLEWIGDVSYFQLCVCSPDQATSVWPRIGSAMLLARAVQTDCASGTIRNHELTVAGIAGGLLLIAFGCPICIPIVPLGLAYCCWHAGVLGGGDFKLLGVLSMFCPDLSFSTLVICLLLACAQACWMRGVSMFWPHRVAGSACLPAEFPFSMHILAAFLLGSLFC